MQSQIQLADAAVPTDGHGLSHIYTPADLVAPLMVSGGPQLPSVFDEDCLSSVPSYLPLNPSSPSCSFLCPASMAATFMPATAGPITAALSVDSSGIFGGSILMGSELQPQDLEFQGDIGGIFCLDSIQRVFKPGDLQVLV